MQLRRLIGLLLGLLLWLPTAAAEEQPRSTLELTYKSALALARKQAPTLAVARARAREAEIHVDAAAVRRFNPRLSGAAGSRFGPGSTSLEWSIGAQQQFELGGKRDNRIKAARAAARASAALRDDAQRLFLRDVALAFIEALYWKQRGVLADENLRIAAAINKVTTRRHQVGDVGGLERSVSALAVVRAQTNADRVATSLAHAESRLKTLLGLDETVNLSCTGDLRVLATSADRAPTSTQRPDIEALRAEVDRAQAEAQLGRASWVPNLEFGADYAREESADIIQGTISIPLPVLDHGQGKAAVAEAQRERILVELGAQEKAAAAEMRTAQALARGLGEAARRFEREGMDKVKRSERLATASYGAGAIPLGELLALRRELVQAKLEYADLLLGAATARAELAASLGALQ